MGKMRKQLKEALATIERMKDDFLIHKVNEIDLIWLYIGYTTNWARRFDQHVARLKEDGHV